MVSGKQAFEDAALDQICAKKMVTRKWQERNHVLHWGNQRAVTKPSNFTEQLRTERVWDNTSPTHPTACSLAQLSINVTGVYTVILRNMCKSSQKHLICILKHPLVGDI